MSTLDVVGEVCMRILVRDAQFAVGLYKSFEAHIVHVSQGRLKHSRNIIGISVSNCESLWWSISSKHEVWNNEYSIGTAMFNNLVVALASEVRIVPLVQLRESIFERFLILVTHFVMMHFRPICEYDMVSISPITFSLCRRYI